MRTYDIILNGTNEARLTIDHKFLLILSDEGFTVDLAVLKGSGFAEVKGVQAGFGLRLTDQTRGKEFIFRCSNAQTIKVFVGDDEAIYNRLSGSVTVNGGNLNGINTAVSVVDVIDDFSGFSSTTNLAANTAVQVFSAAANTNGAIIKKVRAFSLGNAHQLVLIAKAGANPANVLDGLVIESANEPLSGTNVYLNLNTDRPIKIAAGLGLFFINSGTESQTQKTVLYKLL